MWAQEPFRREVALLLLLGTYFVFIELPVVAATESRIESEDVAGQGETES